MLPLYESPSTPAQHLQKRSMIVTNTSVTPLKKARSTTQIKRTRKLSSDGFSTPTKSKISKQLFQTPPTQPKKRSDTCRGDRYIPERSLSSDFTLNNLFDLYSNSKFTIDDKNEAENVDSATNCQFSSPSNTEDRNALKQYQSNLDKRLFDGQLKQQKILAIQQPCNHFTNINNNNAESWQTNIRKVYNQNKNGIPNASRDKRNTRNIPSQPEKILDAPGLIDDFYLNLLEWSSTNLLAVALADSVYLWNAETGDIDKLLTCQQSPQNHVTSLAWIDDGSYLAVGTNDNEVQIWDVERSKRLRSLKGHVARVGALSWNSHLLSSGSRSGKIINSDVRIMNHMVSTLAGHSQEVCGLKWSTDGTQLASGGNDNVLNVWDLNQHVANTANNGYMANVTEPRYSFTEHKGAVKALAWCPWNSNLLASGGGTQDRQLKFWNTQTGVQTQSIDTKSQVCSIVWSKHERELVSSHGFSQNQLIVWKYPKLKKIAELTGHTSRVLHLAQSPDGSTVVSGAADETLRFWKIFTAPEDSTNFGVNNSLLSLRTMNIR